MSLIQINGSRVPGDDVFFESIVLLPSHAMPKRRADRAVFQFFPWRQYRSVLTCSLLCR